MSLDSIFGVLDGRKAEVKSARKRCEEAGVTPADISLALARCSADVLDYDNLDEVVDAALDVRLEAETEAALASEPPVDVPDEAKAEPGVYEVYISAPVSECPVGQVIVKDVFRYFGHDAVERVGPLAITRFANIQPLQCPSCRHQWEAPAALRPGNTLSDPENTNWHSIFLRSRYCSECLTKRSARVLGTLYHTPGPNGTRSIQYRQMRPRWFFTSDELTRLQKALAARAKVGRYVEEKIAGGKTRRKRVGWDEYPIEVQWMHHGGGQAVVDDKAAFSGTHQRRFASEIVRIVGPLALDGADAALLQGEELSVQHRRLAQIDGIQKKIHVLLDKLMSVSDPREMKRYMKQIGALRDKAQQLQPAT